jgi:2-iminobutanoate/2-iminopropanoate deaminase
MKKLIYLLAISASIVMQSCGNKSESSTDKADSTASAVHNMEKRIINPWTYQDEFGYVQAIEVKNPQGTLYCAGQAALDKDGKPSSADMRSQLAQSLENLETVIAKSGYRCEDIVRLNIYTTSVPEIDSCFNLFTAWAKKNHVRQTSTLLEVKGLFIKSLKVEIEATLVK